MKNSKRATFKVTVEVWGYDFLQSSGAHRSFPVICLVYIVTFKKRTDISVKVAHFLHKRLPRRNVH
jgi:hypothetical protein